MRVALATCAEVPDLDEDGPALLAALERRGIEGVPAVWDEPAVEWRSFDLVVVRSTWDYAERRDAFLAWAESLPRVLNRPQVLRWNTDKRYLRELASAGVPVVPTRFLEPGDEFEPPAGRFVVKPAVSAGSRRSARYDANEAERAHEHVRRLQSEGRVVMIQPYLDAIDERGETAVVYLAGTYSHAVAKGALLRSGAAPGEALYLEETITAREPTAEERGLAEHVMHASTLPSSALLYGRVDLAPGADGRPVVLELELAEPSLFLGFADGAVERFADAIDAALRASR